MLYQKASTHPTNRPSPQRLVLLPVVPQEEGVEEEEDFTQYRRCGEEAGVDEGVEADDVHRERREDDRGECVASHGKEHQAHRAGEGDERQHVRGSHQRTHERPTGFRVELCRGSGEDACDAQDGSEQEQADEHAEHDAEDFHEEGRRDFIVPHAGTPTMNV